MSSRVCNGHGSGIPVTDSLAGACRVSNASSIPQESAKGSEV